MSSQGDTNGTTSTSVKHLLELLLKQNEKDSTLLQNLHLAETSGIECVPTLTKGIFQSASPMLTARLEFAGRWENAYAGLTFLSISDMGEIFGDEKVQRQIQNRITFDKKSVVSLHARSDISIFAIDTVEQNEIYMLWGISPEPRIFAYLGYDKYEYKNILEFLLAITR